MLVASHLTIHTRYLGFTKDIKPCQMPMSSTGPNGFVFLYHTVPYTCTALYGRVPSNGNWNRFSNWEIIGEIVLL